RVKERCLFLGYKENALDYFKFFDVYVMSSRSEGFGLCIIEAASQNVPIICNQLTVFDELFDTDEAIRFDLSNLQSIMNAVNLATQNKTEICAKANKRYLDNYTSEKMTQKYLAIYKCI
ncbi:MAG: glycosyltransferase, partial [Flammeovirgaceae bacterium]